MKVLWLTNTPCNANKLLAPNMVTGGWLNALESELTKTNDIELHIMFYWGKNKKPFILNNTKYYPIYRENSKNKIFRFIKRLFAINNDNVEIEKISKTINLISPDIVHIHGTEENFGLIYKTIAIPQVISIQGLLLPYSEKFFSGLSYNKILRNESIIAKIKLNSLSLIFKQFKKNTYREKQMLFYAKNVIGRTDWDKRVTRVIAPKSKYYINNEIMRNVFYLNKWSKNYNTKIFTITSIITNGYYKGLETLIKTAQILKEYNLLEFCWNIIGITQNSEYGYVVKNILKCNYSELPINFLGMKNENEVAELMLKSDLYCQVSHIENSPNSVCEAMLLGMPIIASFAGGTDSIIEHKKTGILVQDGDPYSLSGAIVELSKDPQMSITLGENAYILARKRHDRVKITEQLIDIYKTIIKKNNSK